MPDFELEQAMDDELWRLQALVAEAVAATGAVPTMLFAKTPRTGPLALALDVERGSLVSAYQRVVAAHLKRSAFVAPIYSVSFSAPMGTDMFAMLRVESRYSDARCFHALITGHSVGDWEPFDGTYGSLLPPATTFS